MAIAFQPARSVTSLGLHDEGAVAGLVVVDVLAGESPILIVAGRAPGKHEAAIAEGAAVMLRMDQPLASSVSISDGTQLPIVGVFDSGDYGAISNLLSTAVVTAADKTEHYGTVAFLAREPSDVATIVEVTNLVVADRRTTNLFYDPRAADVEQTVADSAGGGLAAIALIIVGIGGLVQLASALLNATLQRRENARRRALGFKRWEIMTLLAFQAGIVSFVGGAIGTGSALIRLALNDAPVQASQALATLGLLLCVAVATSLPGGAASVLQDPARILRVP
jgi:hypothetical protein